MASNRTDFAKRRLKWGSGTRKIDIRLLEKKNSNSFDARPVY